jgi:hypothetical protein
MRVPETFANGVGVLFSIGVAMVTTVTRGPPSDGPLDGACTDSGKVNLERKCGLVARVGPKAVVTCRKAMLLSQCPGIRKTRKFRAELTSSDAETRVEVVDYGPDGSIKVQGNPVRVDHASKGEKDNKCGV